MSTYQVIAKKFRPQKFSEVFEQDLIVQTLKNALRMERMGHAYLFCGTRGTGKTTLARLFAKAINCKKRTEEGEPCNVCPSCKEIIEGHSLDVIEIDGASNRGIDDIRNLNETVGYASSSGGRKIYIIDEVHMLTKEAFNALLKTLEEPPEHVLFFFATTEPHKVLPTILSRCQRFDLKRITPEKIEEKLSAITKTLSIQVEKEALALVAHHAEGSLRDAESLLDQLLCFQQPPITLEHATQTLGLVKHTLFFKLDQAVKHHDLAAAFTLSETIFQSGCHLQHFLESLIDHYRKIALIQMGHKAPLPEYETAATCYTKHHILEILDYLIDALEKGSHTPFKRIHLEVSLLHIIKTAKKISLESLVERLETLQASPSEAPKVEPPKPGESTPPPPKPKTTPPPVAEKVKTPEPPKVKTPKPVESPPPPPEPKPIPQQVDAAPLPSIQQKIKHEQVMRFAAVELSGTLKK